MNVSFELNEQEQKIVEDYAKLHSVTVEQAFKQALFEKINKSQNSLLGNSNNFIGPFGGFFFG